MFYVLITAVVWFAGACLGARGTSIHFCNHTWEPVTEYTTADYVAFLKVTGAKVAPKDSIAVVVTGGKEKMGERIYLKGDPSVKGEFRSCMRFDLQSAKPLMDGDLDMALPKQDVPLVLTARADLPGYNPVVVSVRFRKFDVLGLALEASEQDRDRSVTGQSGTSVATATGWSVYPVSDWSGIKKARRIKGAIFGESSPAKGPLVITGDVVVPAGKTLELLPGSVILCKGDYRLTVEGALIARGTADAPVTFSGLGTKPAWQGIVLGADGAAANLTSCIIEYASRGLTVTAAESVTVQDCYFRLNGFAGVAVEAAAGQAVFFHNTVTGSEHGITLNGETQPLLVGNIIRDVRAYGIFCDNGARPVIANNVICGNASGGIFCGTGCLAVIERNKLYDNGSGIHCVNSEPMVTGNEITENRLSGIVCLGTAMPVITENIICYNKLYNLNNATANPIEAPGNWWGQKTMSELYADQPNITSIFDGHDRPGFGPVNCIPFATEPSGLAGIPKISVTGFTVAPDPHFLCPLSGTLSQGTRLFYQIIATDINPGKSDAMWVTVTASRTTPRGISLQAVETGPGSGIYTGTFMIMDSTIPAYNQLGASCNETVTVAPVNAPSLVCSIRITNQRPRIEDLKVMDACDPMNLPNVPPRFGWHYEDEHTPLLARLVAYLKPEQQAAFLRNYYARGNHIPKQCEVVVGTDRELSDTVWHSGPVGTDDTTLVYGGPPLTPGTTYHIRLRAGDGSLWSLWESTRLHINGRPSSPSLFSPDPEARVTSLYPVLAVNRPYDPEDRELRYTYLLAADPGFRDTVDVISGIVSADTVVSAVPQKTLQENRRYYWKASVRDPYHNAQWTGPSSFYVDAVAEEIPLFSLLAPHDGDKLPDACPTLHWQDARDADPLDTTWYRLEISTDPSFAVNVIVIDKLRKNQYTLKKALTAGNTYYWRVKAYTAKQILWAEQQNYSFSVLPSD